MYISTYTYISDNYFFSFKSLSCKVRVCTFFASRCTCLAGFAGIRYITGRMPKYPVDNGSSYVELTDVISRRLLASYYSRPPATSIHESTTYLSLRDEFSTCHRNLLFSLTRKTNSLQL